MTMKKRDFLLISIMCILVCVLWPKRCGNTTVTKVERDTVTATETIYHTTEAHDTIPVYIEKTIKGTDTIYVVDADTAKPVVMKLAQKTYGNTIVQDSDTITYKAYLTGRSYEGEDYPVLDSINFILSVQKLKEVQTITETITRSQKPRKWHLSANAGAGYGLINRKPDIYVGVGVSYTIW